LVIHHAATGKRICVSQFQKLFLQDGIREVLELYASNEIFLIIPIEMKL